MKIQQLYCLRIHLPLELFYDQFDIKTRSSHVDRKHNHKVLGQ